jgi:hypothetical protein
VTDESGQQIAADRIAEWDAKVCHDLMSTPQGRFLMERFLDYCCEGRDLYLNDGDALGMAMRDGMARAGRWWRVMIEEHCPDLFLRMIRERRSRFARAQARLKAQETEAQDDGLTPSGTPIEAMADEQERKAAEEEARRAKAEQRQRRPKKDR